MRPEIFKIISVLLLAVLAAADYAAAHSTAGRIRIDLELEKPAVDDFAYFMESYVHRHLYESRFARWRQRFYVKEFQRVEQQGNRAVVHFLTLDFKEKTEFPDSMTFERNKDGVWYYRPEGGGERVRVHTYVRKWGYYYQHYILPGSLAGLSLALGFLAFLVIRKKKVRPGPNAGEV